MFHQAWEPPGSTKKLLPLLTLSIDYHVFFCPDTGSLSVHSFAVLSNNSNWVYFHFTDWWHDSAHMNVFTCKCSVIVDPSSLLIVFLLLSSVSLPCHRAHFLILGSMIITSVRMGFTLKVLNFWKFTSYCSLKPLWSGMGEVVLARTSPTLHPPSPPTVHQLSRLAL